MALRRDSIQARPRDKWISAPIKTDSVGAADLVRVKEHNKATRTAKFENDNFAELKEGEYYRGRQYATGKQRDRLEITKGGRLRTETEIQAIGKAIWTSKRDRKDKKMQAHLEVQEKKERTLRNARDNKRQWDDYDPNFIVQERKPIVKKERIRHSQEEIEKRAKKQEATLIREMNNRKKAAKKERKQQRKEDRKTLEVKSEGLRDFVEEHYGYIFQPDGDSVFIDAGYMRGEYLRIREMVPYHLRQMFTEVDYVVCLVVFLRQVYRSHDAEDVSNAAYMYLSTSNEYHPIEKGIACFFIARLFDSYKAYFKTEPKIVSEALSDQLQSAADLGSMLFENSAALALRDFIVGIASLKVLPLNVASEIYKWCGKPEGKMSILEVIKNSFESLSKIVKVFELLCAGVSPKEAFFLKDPYSVMLNDARELLLYTDKLYSGLPVEGRMDRAEFLTRGLNCVKYFKMVKENTNPLSSKHRECMSMYLQLLDSVTTVQNMVKTNSRPTPVSVLIVGPPAIGKSRIVNLVAKIMCDVRKREFKESYIFHRNPASEFWEGYEGASTPIIHYSELGAVHKNIVKTRGDPLLQEFLSVADSLPFPVNMATLDLKGKVFCCPEMVVVDTNNPDINAQFAVNNPAAIRRRFIYIEPIVKPEYRLGATNGLDSSKVPEGTDFYDKWVFRVTKRPAVDSVVSTEETIMSGCPTDTYLKLCSTLYKLFKEHVEREQEVLDAESRTKFDYHKYDSVENFPTLASIPLKDWSLSEVKEVKSEALLLPWFTFQQFREKCSDVSQAASVTGTLTYNYVWYKSKSVVASIVGNEVPAPVGSIFHVDFWRFMIQFLLLIVFCLGGFSWFNGVIYFILTILDYKACCQAMGHAFIHQQRDDAERRANAHYTALMRYWNVEEGIPNFDIELTVKCAKYAAIAATLLVGGGFAWSMLFREEKKKSEAHTSFVVKSDVDEKINEIEETLSCGHSYPRVSNAALSVWNEIKPSKTSMHNDTVEELHSLAQRNVRTCVVQTSKCSVKTHLFGIKGNFALINTHSLSDRSSLIIKVATTCKVDDKTMYRDTHVSNDDVIDLGNDISVVRLSQISFVDLTHHLCPDVNYPKWADGKICAQKVKAYYNGSAINMNDTSLGVVTLSPTFRYNFEKHDQGSCGLPLVINRDKNNCIVGIHAAGEVNSPQAYAVIIVKEEVINAITTLSNKNLMLINSESVNCHFAPLEEPNGKSPFRYENFHNIDYYGKVPGPVMMNDKSKLQQSYMRIDGSLAEIFFETLGFIPSQRFDRPVMKPFMREGQYISPYNLGLRKLNRPRKALNRKLLKRIVDEFVNEIVAGLRAEGVPDWRPLTLEVAINGVDTDPFCRRVDASTSGGFGFVGKKSKYLELVDEKSTLREPNSDVRRRLYDCLTSWGNGDRTHAVYKVHLKDEPREISKVKMGKTRLFYASPLDALILQRMILAPFYTHVVQYGKYFGSAVGVNMHKEAHIIYHDLEEFSEGSDNRMEGDYGNYDQTMPFDIGWAACTVVHDVCKRMGYNDQAMSYVVGALSDNLFPYTDMNGDIFCSPGHQPSGKYATAEDNGIRGNLLLRYAWYVTIGEDLFDKMPFREFVRPYTYGDDVLAAVKPKVQDIFNCVVYAKFVEEIYGMEFTTASKSLDIVKFVDVSTMTFLKRTFKFHKGLGRVVAPLNMDSIYRSLEWIMPSAFVNSDMQFLQTLNSALRELYFHIDDEKTFETLRSKFVKSYCSYYEVEESVVQESLPSFSQFSGELSLEVRSECLRCSGHMVVNEGRRLTCIDRHKDRRHQVAYMDAMYEERVASISALQIDGLVTAHDILSQSRVLNKWLADFLNILRNERVKVLEELKEAEEKLESYPNPVPDLNPRELRRLLAYEQNRSFREAVECYIVCYRRVDELSKHLEILNRTISKRSGDVRSESEPVSVQKDGLINVQMEEKHENMIDVSGEEVDQVSTGVLSMTKQLLSTSLDLDSFFSRPVPIAHFDINVGTPASTTVFQSFDVWNLFTAEPTVRAKLRNYAYLRGDLVVKVAVSGTPFHYGKLLVSYLPFPNVNEVLTKYITLGSNWGKNWNIYQSQTPGARVMDVRENQPCEIECSYVSPQPMIRLFNNITSPLSDASPYNDTVHMGDLYISLLNTLGCVAASPTNISVYVYAYMKNVVLGCPTGSVTVITSESKRLPDERKSGPVESAASSVASVSKLLSTVPVIGPYASASETVASAIAGVAAHFGWSYPTNENFASRIKNEPYQNAAHVIGMDTGKRITLDPKQELTIDPRVCGVDQDELALSYISSIESYVDSFDWANSTTPLSGPIWQSVVHPRAGTFILGADASTKSIQPTALAFASMPFQYWRGKMHFRFEVVCSNFHRGKLMVYYEPNIQQNVIINSALATNKQFVRVFDIQETSTIDFCVDWAFPKAWAFQMYESDVRQSMGSEFSTSATMWGCVNGYIGVTPFTKLQSPDGSNVHINVYVSGEDMAFNKVSQGFFPASRTIVSESARLSNVDVTCVELNPTSALMEDIGRDHFGEMPVSFRAMLKRFHTSELTSGVGDVNAQKSLLFKCPIYEPLLPSISTAAADNSNIGLFNYLRYAYLGMRGGMRKRLFVCSDAVKSPLDPLSIFLFDPQTFTVNPVITYNANLMPRYFLSGTVAFVPFTNGGIEFEVPFYTNNLFVWSCNSDPFNTVSTTFETNCIRNYGCEYAGTGNQTFTLIGEATATGEDFNFLRWLSSPPYVSV